jgi:hypothetical protein
MRCHFASTIASVLVFGTCASGDETQYLPDKPHLIISIDLSRGLKSKAFQEYKKQQPDISKQIEASFVHELGIPIEGIARLTLTNTFSDKEPVYKANLQVEGGPEIVEAFTTVKPLNADNILKARSFPGRKQQTTKVGNYTIHFSSSTLTTTGAPGKNKTQPQETVEIEDEAFCIVDDKTLLVGKRPALTRILERNKAPALPANIQLALKEAGFTNTLCVIADLEGLPREARKDLLDSLTDAPILGLKGAVEKIQAISIVVNENEKVKINATVFCKDRDDVQSVKKVGDTTLTFLKELCAKESPEFPAEKRTAIKAVGSLTNAIQLSTTEKTIIASATIEPAISATVVGAILDFYRDSRRKPYSNSNEKK